MLIHSYSDNNTSSNWCKYPCTLNSLYQDNQKLLDTRNIFFQTLCTPADRNTSHGFKFFYSAAAFTVLTLKEVPQKKNSEFEVANGTNYYPNDINHLKPTGHVMHHQFNIQQLYVLPTLCLCVLYLSENKQRLVPLTA